MSLEEGLKALQQKRYSQAIKYLEEYCRNPEHRYSPVYIQAQMALARAYRGDEQRDKALKLGQTLSNYVDPQIKEWAQGFLSILAAEEKATGVTTTIGTPKVYEKAPRAIETNICLKPLKMGGEMALAFIVTSALMFGMILVFCLGLIWICNPDNLWLNLRIAGGITLIFHIFAFFLCPWFMDLSQQYLYKVDWVTLAEIKSKSPESAKIIQLVCRKRKIKQPKLGIVNDQNPTAFSYGSFSYNARLVVSQGLFNYLEDDEIATVYAHELGHIVNWDFALITMASTLIQILYLIYLFFSNSSKKNYKNKILQILNNGAALIAYCLYQIGYYIILLLSRTREYLADHFAAKITGNPNGLSRALVKIAYGILEEERQNNKPSKLMEATRALGIYDYKTATNAGTAYRIALNSRKIGQALVWDLFNPWSKLMELNSTHPLPGKRIRALTNYAEQMGLASEFNMAQIIKEENTLDQGKLYRNFILDLLIFNSPWLGAIAGLGLGIILSSQLNSVVGIFSLILLGFGIGTMGKVYVMYPSFKQDQAIQSDIFHLMCDPYASPLRGSPIYLRGKLIAQGDAGAKFGSDLKIQDQTGLISAPYTSRFGPLGNFFLDGRKVENLIGVDVSLVGWFRRGIAPWLDWQEITSQYGQINSYPRFWSLIVGISAIMIGFVLLIFAIA